MNTTTLAEVPVLPCSAIHGTLRSSLQWVILLLCDFFAFSSAAAFALAATLPLDKMWGANAGATWLPLGQWPRLSIFLASGLVWLLWFGIIRQAYTRRTPFWTELKQLVLGVAVFCTADLTLLTFTHVDFAQTWWASAWLPLLMLLPGARHIGRKLLRSIGLWQQPTVIIGKGENAWQAYLTLKNESDMGFDVVAFVWPSYAPSVSTGVVTVQGIPCVVLGPQPEATRQLLPFHCVIALEADERELRDNVIRQLADCRITNVHVIPAMRGVPLYGMETSHFLSHEVLMIHLRSSLANPLRCALKRVFDLFGSIMLLVLLSPLFALLAYKVSRDGGKPIFGHVRVGHDGKPFKCLKFRSMVVNAQEALQHLLDTDPVAKSEWDKDFKLKNDPRINKVGHFLRRTSLDELPQLWNVLRGDMSLVGPRPVVQGELERYGDDVTYYLMTRPGMTGLWQVSGRNDLDYSTRVYLDTWYVKNWSLWGDIAILFKTIAVVTRRNGAY